MLSDVPKRKTTEHPKTRDDAAATDDDDDALSTISNPPAASFHQSGSLRRKS